MRHKLLFATALAVCLFTATPVMSADTDASEEVPRREGKHWVYTSNLGNGDFDSDGIPDAKDNDDDGDGIRDDRDLDKDNDHFVDIWNRADLHAHRRELRE